MPPAILLGHDRQTGKPIEMPLSAFERHLHFIGYTGSGKTTAIVTLLKGLLRLPGRGKCVIVLDRLGGFSHDLLRWFASDLYCPARVRDRVIYLEGAREDQTIGFNPLLYSTPGEGYYRTARAAEIVLSGWDSQDLAQMPRLARWLFNSFWAAAQLGLAIADLSHLLFPGSELHKPLLNALPDTLRAEWGSILKAMGNQAEIQLESTRNRLAPFFRCPMLKGMFSATTNRFDVTRWMRERKIVVVNLAPLGKLPPVAADMIGGLIVNEVFSVARSLPPEERVETLLVLDEFQRFISADLEFALAESRQLKTHLLLSHQSFAQLKTSAIDLTSLILQAQTRLMLKVGGEDADLLARELTAMTYDKLRVKAEIHHRTQRVSGHRVTQLNNWTQSEALAKEWSEAHARQTAESVARARKWNDPDHETTVTRGRNAGENWSNGTGEKQTRATGHGVSETLVPEYEEYLQLASQTFETFDEQAVEWGKCLRRAKPGEGVYVPSSGDRVQEIAVQRLVEGHLALPWEVVRKKMPAVVAGFEALRARNDASEWFTSMTAIDRETEERLRRVLQGSYTIYALPAVESDTTPAEVTEPPATTMLTADNPFP